MSMYIVGFMTGFVGATMILLGFASLGGPPSA